MSDSEVKGKIIKGDNAVVLDCILAAGQKVKCIYIDPPYNNGDDTFNYKDSFQDNEWLSMMERVIIPMRDLLTHDGSLWISIDDSMMHYLKVLVDRIFGRANFVATFVWEHRTTRENRAVVSRNHEYILAYAKNMDAFKKTRNLLKPTSDLVKRFSNPDNDPRGPWQSISLTAQAAHATPSQFYEFRASNGNSYFPPRGRCWVYSEAKMLGLQEDARITFGKCGNGVPRLKKFYNESKLGLTPHTLWKADEVGTTASAKKHVLSLFGKEEVFETPKPEQLIERILDIATNPGDLVLDAYLGSGTTASVAHKKGRRYIGVEIGDHVLTHCVQRLRQVCAGEQGGISSSMNWKGGGSFSFEAA